MPIFFQTDISPRTRQKKEWTTQPTSSSGANNEKFKTQSCKKGKQSQYQYSTSFTSATIINSSSIQKNRMSLYRFVHRATKQDRTKSKLYTQEQKCLLIIHAKNCCFAQLNSKDYGQVLTCIVERHHNCQVPYAIIWKTKVKKVTKQYAIQFSQPRTMTANMISKVQELR